MVGASDTLPHVSRYLVDFDRVPIMQPRRLETSLPTSGKFTAVDPALRRGVQISKYLHLAIPPWAVGVC